MWYIPISPERASTIAGEHDLLFLAITLLAVFFTVMVAGGVVFFGIKYRRGSAASRVGGADIHGDMRLEISWIVIPLILGTLIFAWAAVIYFRMYRAPADATEMYVTGKQWMWKAQHPTGQREINELHVPVNTPIKLIMTSQDVIHSFYVPAFRIKQDVIPGRTTEVWFEATQVGQYHIFCAEYCGTLHAGMIGRVVVMDEADYEAWLRGGGQRAASQPGPGQGMANAGRQAFQRMGCSGCHRANGSGPSLAGVFGSQVQLADGSIVEANEDYIVNSILNPGDQIVAGYENIMPSFQDALNQEELLELVAYIKSLSEQGQGGGQGGEQGTSPMINPGGETGPQNSQGDNQQPGINPGGETGPQESQGDDESGQQP